MKDKDFIKLAHERFKRCEEAESHNLALWRKDLRFANADSENGWQWDEDLRKKRSTDARPCLTINKVKQHNLQITNEAKKNRSSPKVIPVDNGADEDTAEVLNGIIRHIEAMSCADSAYGTAFEFSVDAGLGYWRIVTEYANDRSFDQEIYIKRVKNPLNIYLDPDIDEADGSDAMYGFVFDDMPKAEFESKYPKASRLSKNWDALDNGWRTEDTVRICEYFVVEKVEDTLYADQDGNTFMESELDADQKLLVKGSVNLRSRRVISNKIKWYYLAGDEILEEKEWLGKYIPIVRVVGEERVIDGKVERKGHTRSLKDAQKMYNFWTSSAAEFVSLQGKQPYIAPAEAIQGYEAFWNNANKDNLPYLPYNQYDDEGRQINQPQKQQPPVMAQAYINGMQIASDEMQAASGQYDAQLGENANQQSGRALLTLQRKGDNATFHFTDNSDLAKRYTAKILVDLIPKIYDTPRVQRIIGDDGSEKMVEINPSQQQSSIKKKDELTGKIKGIYNLNVGRYDVVPTVGASYATKRQEAAESMIAMTQANPSIWQTHGDLIVKAQDWPMAEEFSKRFQKVMPPELIKSDETEEEPQIPPEIQQAMQEHEQQIQQLDELVQTMTVEIDNKDKELDNKLQIVQLQESTKLKVAELAAERDLRLQQMENELEAVVTDLKRFLNLQNQSQDEDYENE